MMFNVYSVEGDIFDRVKLLATFPMETMKAVFKLDKEAVTRIESETANNGICQFFFNRTPVPGFGKKVVIQAAHHQSDEMLRRFFNIKVSMTSGGNIRAIFTDQNNAIIDDVEDSPVNTAVHIKDELDICIERLIY